MPVSTALRRHTMRGVEAHTLLTTGVALTHPAAVRVHRAGIAELTFFKLPAVVPCRATLRWPIVTHIITRAASA